CLGTIHFMAPEQFDDAKRVDSRSDIYSLSATLYFALTGVPPFLGRGNLAVLKKKLQNEFLRPRERVSTLPIALDRIICRGLEAESERRLSSLSEFSQTLTDILATCPPD